MLHIFNSFIRENESKYGGGIYSYGGYGQIIENTIINNNIANGVGGFGVADYNCNEYDLFEDCVGACFPGTFLSWIGDGWCDDGYYGLDFMCEAWNFDNGDCEGLRQNTIYNTDSINPNNKSQYNYRNITRLPEGEEGGGIYSIVTNSIIANSTISQNSGGGLRSAGWVNSLVVNSVIWDNIPSQVHLGDDSITFAHTNLQGGELELQIIPQSDIIWSTGNIDLDPLFIDSENMNFSLQENSPCIDAGTPYFEYEGEIIVDIPNSEYYGLAPDMGAYEFGESSEIMAGDTNFDGIVDILDIVRIVDQIMGNSEFNDDEFIAADFNDDSIVDILDIVQIVNYILAN